jgi:hypothetical protein
VATVIALASFHWEASFDFTPTQPMALHTVSSNTEFTNMPEPIVLDYNFDGRNEVLLSFDRSIALFQWSGIENDLLELARFQTATQPILMTYIGPEKPQSGVLAEMRKPLVLILTAENFNVTCLSYPELKPLWSTRLPGIARFVRDFDHLALAEHDMVADYTALYKGDVGAVFVTIRFDSEFDVAQTQGSSSSTVNNLDVVEEKVLLNGKNRDGGDKRENTGTGQNTQFDPELAGIMDKQEQMEIEYVTRPSFFALDLLTGHMRWRNTARDEHSRLSLHDVDVDANGDDDQEEMSQTAHDYRRHLAEKSQHFEEGNWRVWKDELIEYGLPHQWYTTRHTSLTPVRFSATQDEAAERRGRRQAKQTTADFEDPYRYLHNTYQHALPKSANNVLLYEHSQGITVIHLYTGRILTRLPLPPFRTYADANGDQTINSFVIDEQTGTVHVSTLYEEAGTIDHSRVYTSKLPGASASLVKLHRDGSSPSVEFVPPLLLPASTRFSNPGASYNGALGQSLAQILPDLDLNPIPDKAYYMIFLNSQGYMYCMRTDTGDVQWVVETDAAWAGLQALRSAIYGGFKQRVNAIRNEVRERTEQKRQDARVDAAEVKGDIHARRKFGKGRRPKEDLEEDKTRLDKRLSAILLPFSIEAKETHPTGVLAVTPAGLVLVGPDGSILAREVTHLPTVSKTTLPVIADFTNDGRNDIILATHRGYHLYVLETGKSHVYPLLVACFLLCLLIIAGLKIIETRKSANKTSIRPRTTLDASNFFKAE